MERDLGLRDACLGRRATATARDEGESETGEEYPDGTRRHYGLLGQESQSMRTRLHNGVQAANTRVFNSPAL